MRFRRSTVVQSLLLAHGAFATEAAAKRWARDHGFRSGKVDDSVQYWRVRQADPALFQPGSFRTIEFGDWRDHGIRAVIGVPRRDVRNNPDLIILTNPGGQPPNAPAAWGNFHLAEPDDADWEEVGDIPGLPPVVWALGFFEGGEWEDDRGRIIDAHTTFTIAGGPWLVSAPNDPKALWVVARRPDQLTRFARFDGALMPAIYYFPNETSGKFDPDRGYRHEFGDGGKLKKRDWPATWPAWERVHARAFEVVAPHRDGFKIERAGIVG